jgi:pimeloyl-ACP methyl ester carboxylesterase
MQTDLHVVESGAGERILFVHGFFDCGMDTFPEQPELADRYRVLMMDRRGYGESPPAERVDFDSQVQDVCAVLGDGAHLVGHSYGGLLCLLVAAQQPDAMRSLTVIEPPAFAVTRGNRAVETLVERLAAWRDQADPSALERLLPQFMVALGFDQPSVQPTANGLAAALRTLLEPPPWEADVALEVFAATAFPKLVVSGAWDIAPEHAREIAGRAHIAVCDALEEQLGAERAGGADTIRQALTGGHMDELVVTIAPVVLGGGKALFEGFDHSLDLQQVDVRQSKWATHLRYLVKK